MAYGCFWLLLDPVPGMSYPHLPSLVDSKVFSVPHLLSRYLSNLDARDWYYATKHGRLMNIANCFVDCPTEANLKECAIAVTQNEDNGTHTHVTIPTQRNYRRLAMFNPLPEAYIQTTGTHACNNGEAWNVKDAYNVV